MSQPDAALLLELGVLLDEFDKEITKAQSKIASAGKKLASTGKKLTASITVPLMAMGATVLKVAGDFEQGMNKVGAITGANAERFKKLEDQARRLGETTQFSAREAADAMSFLGMAGLDVNQIMSSMPATLDLAAAGQMDLASAADIASNVLSGYGLDVSELGNAVDVMAKTFTSANTDLRGLGEAMSYVAPVASSAGVDFEEAAAMIGIFGNAGIQGSRAGTSLRTAIARLLDPTTKVAATIEELGLNTRDSEGNLVSMQSILMQLEQAGARTEDVMRLFGLRAGPAMAAALKQGTGELEKLKSKLEDAGGTAQEIAEKQLAGFKGQMTKLKSAAEGLAIAIAESGLLEAFTSIAERVTDFVSRLSQTNPEILKWGTIIAGLAAAIGPLLAALGTMAAAIGAISAPVAIAVAAIAALTAVGIALYKNWDTVVAFFKTRFPNAIEFAVAAWEGLKSIVSRGIKEIADFWDKYGDLLVDRVRNSFEAILTSIDTAIGIIHGIIEMFMGLLTGDWSRAWEGMKKVFSSAWDGIKRLFLLHIDTLLGGLEGFLRFLGVDLADGVAGIRDELGTMIDARKIEREAERTQRSMETMSNASSDAIDDFVSSGWSLQDQIMQTADTQEEAASKQKQALEDVTEATEANTDAVQRAASEVESAVQTKVSALENFSAMGQQAYATVGDASENLVSGSLAGVAEDFERRNEGMAEAAEQAAREIEESYADLDINSALKDALVEAEQDFAVLTAGVTGTFQNMGQAVGDVLSSKGGIADMLSYTAEHGVGALLQSIVSLNPVVGGALSVLQSFGVDVNAIFDGISNTVGNVASAVGSLFGIGGGDNKLVDPVWEAVDSINEAFAEIERRAEAMDAVGIELDAVAEKISVMEDELIRLIEEGVDPSSDSFQRLKADLDELRAAAEGFGDGAQGTQEAIAALEDALRLMEQAGLDGTPAYEEAAERLAALKDAAGAFGDIEGIEDEIEKVQRDIENLMDRIRKESDDRVADILREQLEELYGELDRLEGQADDLRNAAGGAADGLDDLDAMQMGGILEDLADQMAEIGIKSEVLGEGYDAQAAQVAALEQALIALRTMGLEATNPVIQDLMEQLAAARAAMNDTGREVEGFVRKVREATRGIRNSRYDDILDGVADAFDEAANRAYVLGEEYNYFNDQVRALERAMIELLNQGMDPASDQFQELQEQLEEARKRAEEFGDAADEVFQEADVARQIMDDLADKLNHVAARHEVYGDSINAAEERVRAIQRAMVEMIEAGVDPMSDAFKNLEAMLKDAQAAADAYSEAQKEANEQQEEGASGGSSSGSGGSGDGSGSGSGSGSGAGGGTTNVTVEIDWNDAERALRGLEVRLQGMDDLVNPVRGLDSVLTRIENNLEKAFDLAVLESEILSGSLNERLRMLDDLVQGIIDVPAGPVGHTPLLTKAGSRPAISSNTSVVGGDTTIENVVRVNAREVARETLKLIGPELKKMGVGK